MFYSLIIIAVIGIIIYSLKRWQKLPEAERNGFAKKVLIYGLVVLILGLVLTGRAHWLMGIVAALLAFVGRVAQFLQYIPLFKKIFGQEKPTQSGPNQSPAQSVMSRQEAADILGVNIDASEEEIRMAHKKLMQKNHPDRGGSDALAKQINQAKDILLS